MCSEHLGLLESAAILPEAVAEAGIRCVHNAQDLPEEHRDAWRRHGSGILFPWSPPSGELSWQFRPDVPALIDGRQCKYLFPAGQAPVLDVHPWMRDPVANHLAPLVIVEGTKQHLAAVSALGRGASLAVVGMAGCWGWSSKGAPSAALIALPVKGRSVVVIMDADLRSNPNVYDAAERLSQTLVIVQGAREVKFVHLPGGGTSGLDDLLARLECARRPEVVANIITSAEAKLGSRPKMQTGDFMGNEGPKVRVIAEDICASHHLAIGPDGDIWAYRDGVFSREQGFLAGQVAHRLGDAYRAAHLPSVRDMVEVLLRERKKVVPEHQDRALLNVANGMLDPLTGTLVPHDPAYLSITQVPVPWDPSDQAPYYEAWIRACVDDQVQDLEEAVSAMLDPTRIPSKAGLLFGPGRSGKSTLQRIAAAIAGRQNASSVTLHALADNRFASANLVGKMLNTAADMSARHLEDLAAFKMLTGGDPVTAERKGQQQFQFVNRAMMMFSANTIPSTGEHSNAYMDRVKPFEFAVSFAGAEDPSVEDRLLTELPGILVRWVQALQRRRERGAYLPTRRDVAATFAAASDQVRAFLDEATVADEVGTPRDALYRQYQSWAEQSGHQKLVRKNFYGRLRGAGVEEYRHRDRGHCFRVRVCDQGGPGQNGDGGGPGEPGTPGPGGSSVGRDSCDSSGALPAGLTGPVGDLVDSRTECPPTITTITGATCPLVSTAPVVRAVVVLPGQGKDPSPSVSLTSGTTLIGHGLLTEGLHPLTDMSGLGPHELAGRCHDLLTLARLHDPLPGGSKPSVSHRRHSIQSLASRHGLPWDDSPSTQESTLRALALAYPMTAYGMREHRVLGITGHIRLTGFRVDQSALQRLLEGATEHRNALIDNLVDLGLPRDGKDGHPARDPLNTDLGREFIVRYLTGHGVHLPVRESGRPDTSKDSLEEISQGLPGDHPARDFIGLVLQARTGSGVLKQVQSHLTGDRVYPMLDPSQATGRFSVTGPGLTVIGKQRGREVFLPEPGEVIITADLAQIDARAVAAHCQDPAYLKMFEPGRDLHTEVAARVLGDAKYRNIAKVINHATTYGAGADLIARHAGVSPEEARRFLEEMQSAYPLWAHWRRDTTSRARAGQLLDNGFGRSLRPNPDRLHTTSVAMVGQSAARDLLVECLFRLDDAGLTPHMRLLVHDEVVFSVPARDVEDYRRVIEDCMTFEWAPSPRLIPVGIVPTVSPGAPNWGAAYGK